MNSEEQCGGYRTWRKGRSGSGRFADHAWLKFVNEGGLAAVLGLLMVGCAGERSRGVADYRERYDKPLVSSGALFASLPPAVQNTIRAETGSADLDEAVRDTSSGRTVYRVYFQNEELFPPLYIAPDGRLLDPNLMLPIGAPHDTSSVVTGGRAGGITLDDLPPAVIKAIQHHAPDAEVDSIMKQVSGDQTTYLVMFKGRIYPPLQLASDGSILTMPTN